MQAAGPSVSGVSVPIGALLNQHAETENTATAEQQTAIITCPKKMVGRVIGKNGETIKALQNFTGAQIQIDQRLDPTRVSIAGPASALIQASNMVQDIVAGTFKGFAMLRAYANQGSRNNSGYDLMSQQAPHYIKGYGFVPPSQFTGDPAEANVLPAFGNAFAAQQSQNGFVPQSQFAPQQPQNGFVPQNQFAAQNGFLGQNGFGTQYQNGLSNMMPLTPFEFDRYQQQQLALAQAQAQLMSASQRVQQPQMTMPTGNAMSFPQAGPSFGLNAQSAYNGSREADPNSLTAQLEAMSMGDTSNLPSTRHVANHNGHNGLNGHTGLNGHNSRSSTSTQGHLHTGGPSNYNL